MLSCMVNYLIKPQSTNYIYKYLQLHFSLRHWKCPISQLSRSESVWITLTRSDQCLSSPMWTMVSPHLQIPLLPLPVLFPLFKLVTPVSQIPDRTRRTVVSPSKVLVYHSIMSMLNLRRKKTNRDSWSTSSIPQGTLISHLKLLQPSALLMVPWLL